MRLRGQNRQILCIIRRLLRVTIVRVIMPHLRREFYTIPCRYCCCCCARHPYCKSSTSSPVSSRWSRRLRDGMAQEGTAEEDGTTAATSSSAGCSYVTLTPGWGAWNPPRAGSHPFFHEPWILFLDPTHTIFTKYGVHTYEVLRSVYFVNNMIDTTTEHSRMSEANRLQQQEIDIWCDTASVVCIVFIIWCRSFQRFGFIIWILYCCMYVSEDRELPARKLLSLSAVFGSTRDLYI